MAVRAHVSYLKQRVNNAHDNIQIVEFDLYKLMLEVL
jgi:hypothetical protein